MAEYFLHTVLPNMPLDHHGRTVADILSECINQGIRFVAEYINKRFLQSSQLRKIDRCDGTKNIIGEDGYHIAACDLNEDEKVVKDLIFEDGNDGGIVGVYVLDIPRIHNPNDPVAHEFIKALS